MNGVRDDCHSFVTGPGGDFDNKKLDCRRGTARRSTSVTILPSAAKLYEKSNFKCLERGQWPWRSLKVIGNGTSILEAIYNFILVIRSNNVSVLHRLRCITTFTVHVTACDREKSFRFDAIVHIVGRVRFTLCVANMCYIFRIWAVQRSQTAKVSSMVTQSHWYRLGTSR